MSDKKEDKKEEENKDKKDNKGQKEETPEQKAKKQQIKDEIKKYKLLDGNYQIQIRVIEANELIPKPTNFFFGSDDICNAFTEVKIGEKVKKTKVKEKTFSPIWNKGMTFRLEEMKKQQLEQLQIHFTVKDKKSIVDTETVGAYSLDLTSVYFSYQHEMYMTWLTLTDPEDEVDGVMGYLKVNIVVLGPEDEPPVHDLDWQKGNTAGKEKALMPQKVQQQGHQIKMDVFRAEHLAPLDASDVIGPSSVIQAYTKVKYSGQSKKTKKIESTNPEWNQRIFIQCMLPNNSRNINVSVFDYDLTSADDLVGGFNIKFKDIQDKLGEPRWANLYGSPVSADNEEATLMNQFGDELGSHYRGRIFYKISTYYKQNPKTMIKSLKFKFPHNPYPNNPQKTYILRVEVLEGIELPQRKSAIIHAQMGPYLLKTTEKWDHDAKQGQNYDEGDPKVSTLGDGQGFFYERLRDKKVLFPIEIDQCPDLIIYFANENKESARHSFQRIKASDLICRNVQEYYDKWEPRIINLKEDRSLNLIKDDEFPGFLYIRAALIAFDPRQIIEEEKFMLQSKYGKTSLKLSRKNKHPDIVYEPKQKISDLPGQPMLPRNQIRLRDPTEHEIIKNIPNKKKTPENYKFPLSKFTLMKPKLNNYSKYTISFKINRKDRDEDLIFLGLAYNLETDELEDIENKQEYYSDILDIEKNLVAVCSNGEWVDPKNQLKKQRLKKIKEEEEKKRRDTQGPNAHHLPQQSTSNDYHFMEHYHMSDFDKFSFKQGDIVKMDIELNDNRSHVNFSIYSHIQKENPRLKKTLKFHMENDSDDYNTFIAIGLSNHRSQVEFIMENTEVDVLPQKQQQQLPQIQDAQQLGQQIQLQGANTQQQQQQNQISDTDLISIDSTQPSQVPQKFLRQEEQIQFQKNFNPVPYNSQDRTEYELRVFLYHGRDIPPSDACGTSDPFIQIKCSGQSGYSDICYGTLNPGWFQTISLNVKLNLSSQLQHGMFIVCYDSDVAAKKIDEDYSDIESEIEDMKNEKSKGKGLLDGLKDGLENIKNDLLEDSDSQSEAPSFMDGADIIGRIWVPFDFSKDQYTIPEHGIFNQKTVNPYLDILDPLTVRIDKKVFYKKKHTKMLAILSKPIQTEVQEDLNNPDQNIVEASFIIDGMNSDKQMSIGICNINLQEENDKPIEQTKFLADTSYAYMVSANGEPVYAIQELQNLPENRHNQLQKFKFKVGSLVKISIDLSKKIAWKDKNEKPRQLVPVTYSTKDPKDDTKILKVTYYFPIPTPVQHHKLDDKNYFPKDMYFCVALSGYQDKDEIRFVASDDKLQDMLTQQFQTSKIQKQKHQVPIRYCNPKKYTLIYDPTGQKAGKILLGYALIEKKYSDYVPIQTLKPLAIQKPLSLFFIGLRDIEMDHPEIGEPKKVYTQFDISGDNYDPIKTNVQEVARKGVNVNKMMMIDIDLTQDKEFCPVMDIIAWECSDGVRPNLRKMLGYGMIKIADMFQDFYNNIGNQFMVDPHTRVEDAYKTQKSIQGTPQKDIDHQLQPSMATVPGSFQDFGDSMYIPQEFDEHIHHDHQQHVDISHRNDKQSHKELLKQQVDLEQDINFQIKEYNAIQQQNQLQNEKQKQNRNNLGNYIQYNDIFGETKDDSEEDSKKTKKDLEKNNKLNDTNPLQTDEQLLLSPPKSQQKKPFQEDQIYEEQEQEAVVVETVGPQQKKQQRKLQGKKIENTKNFINLKETQKAEKIGQLKHESEKQAKKFQKTNNEINSLVQQISQDNNFNPNKEVEDGQEIIFKDEQKKYNITFKLDKKNKCFHGFTNKSSHSKKPRKVTKIIITETNQSLYAELETQSEGIEGVIPKKFMANVLRDLMAFCKICDVELQRNVCLFSENIKHEDVMITEANFQASIINIPQNPNALKLALMDPKLQKGNTYKFSFKIKKLTGLISIGVCHSKVFEETYQNNFNGSELGHATYMLCSNGHVYNNLHQGQNNIHISNLIDRHNNKQMHRYVKNIKQLFTAEEGKNIIKCEVDAIQSRIIFYQNKYDPKPNSARINSNKNNAQQQLKQDIQSQAQQTVQNAAQQQLNINIPSQQNKNQQNNSKKKEENKEKQKQKKRLFELPLNILYSHDSYKQKEPFKDIYICVGLSNLDDCIEFQSCIRQEVSQDQQNVLTRIAKQDKAQILKESARNAKKLANLSLSLTSKLNPLNLIMKQKEEEIQVDYDTDPDEDLCITPPWMLKRNVLHDDLEDFFKPKSQMIKIPLMTGQSRGDQATNIFEKFACPEPPEPSIAGYLKCKVIPRLDNSEEGTQKFVKQVEKLKQKMKPQDYVCRLYITRGIHIGGEGNKQDLYLQIDMGLQDEKTKQRNERLKDSTLQKDTNNPDFYIQEDFNCKLPGCSILNVQIYNPSSFGSDDLVGYTKIDLEDRYFIESWQRLNDHNLMKGKQHIKMPLEQRNLLPEDDTGSVGRLEMWVEIIPLPKLPKIVPVHIFPPPVYKFELRVVVWETRNCVLKDEVEECNDIYVRGGLAKGDQQETDIHWRCRGKGSFNWRWKFPVKYPMISEDDFGNDKFKISLWDKDIIGGDDLIGECEISLSQHDLINKAVKRKEKTQMKTSLYTKVNGKLIPKENKKQKQKREKEEKERLKRDKKLQQQKKEEEKKEKAKITQKKKKLEAKEKKRQQMEAKGEVYQSSDSDNSLLGSDEEEEEEEKQQHEQEEEENQLKNSQDIEKNNKKNQEIRSITNKIWFDVFNPVVKMKDPANKQEEMLVPQGQVLLSFELVPVEVCEKEQNGQGRDAPNAFPVLPEPTGRLSFDLRHPLEFIKQLIGPSLYNTICKWICILLFLGVFGYLFVFFFNNLLAVWAGTA